VKRRLIAIACFDFDGPVVRLHDLRNDIEPETQAVAASGLALAASKRIEEVREDVRGMVPAFLTISTTESARVPSSCTATGAAGVPCLKGIADQVDTTWATRSESQWPLKAPT